MSEATPLMIITQSWPWGSKTAVKKTFPNGYMDSELFSVSFTSCYKNWTSKVQNSWYSMIITYKRWFLEKCAKKSELDLFSCKFCLQNYKMKCWMCQETFCSTILILLIFWFFEKLYFIYFVYIIVWKDL